MEDSSKRGIITLLIFALLIGVGYWYFDRALSERDVTETESTDELIEIETTEQDNVEPVVVKNTPVVPSGPKPDSRGFFSPLLDDQYDFGDFVSIKWDQNLIDASTMMIQCTSLECPFVASSIYGRQDINDSVTQKGEYLYKIPTDNSIPAGTYKIVIYSFGRESSLSSNEFTVNGPDGMLPPQKGSYYIKSVFGTQDSYSTFDRIKLTIETREPNGTTASQEEGFNVQIHIFDANNYPGPSIQAVNASYDKFSGNWRANLGVPLDTSKIYFTTVSLYCSLVTADSYCYQSYRNQDEWEEDFTFTVEQ